MSLFRNCKQFHLKSMQVFIVASILLLTLVITVFCVAYLVLYEVSSEVAYGADIQIWDDELSKEQEKWFAKAIEELEVALAIQYKRQTARNVVLFVSSGVSAGSLSAIRFGNSSNRESDAMAWELMPHIGRLKNTCSLTDLCDLSSIGTALFGGVRTNYKVTGLDSAIQHGNCSNYGRHEVKSILEQAVEQGFRTGFVTNQRVTAGIGAALYAHSPDSKWECDAAMPNLNLTENCQDIATQLLTSKVGQNLNVLLGGGRQAFVSQSQQTPLKVVDELACNSNDGRDYIRDWFETKLRQKCRFAVLENVHDLEKAQKRNLDFVLGIFGNGNLTEETLNKPMNQMPEQIKLVKLALKTLKQQMKKDQGYLLVVETSMSLNLPWERKKELLLALNETMSFVLEETYSEETLVLALFTSGNYRQQNPDLRPETDIISNLFADESEEWLEERLARLVTESVVFAKGPQAYLLHGVHEETYMSHVISHALQIGQYANKERKL